jgi:hypothetical protein
MSNSAPAPAPDLFDPGPDIDLDELILGQMYGEIRPLEDRDLRLLTLHGPDQAGASDVQAMRAGHHVIARMVAMGLRQVDIAEETGYSFTRISHLATHSSAFQELVEKYREQITEAVVSHHSKIHFAAGVAVQLVTEELVDNPDNLTPEFKLKAMKELLEHSGYAPASQTKVDMFHHQGLSAAQILELKQKANLNEPHRIQASNLGPAGQDEAASPPLGDASPERPALSEGHARDRELRVGGGMDRESSPRLQPQDNDREAARGEEI